MEKLHHNGILGKANGRIFSINARMHCKKFEGYPQNFRKGTSEPAVPEVQESVSVDDLPF